MDATMPDRGLPLSLWGIWWNAILLLRPAFSRLRTFMWFVTAVAGLTVRVELLGRVYEGQRTRISLPHGGIGIRLPTHNLIFALKRTGELAKVAIKYEAKGEGQPAGYREVKIAWVVAAP